VLLSEAAFIAPLLLLPLVLAPLGLGFAQCKVELSSYRLEAARIEEARRRQAEGASSDALDQALRFGARLLGLGGGGRRRGDAAAAADAGTAVVEAAAGLFGSQYLGDGWRTLLWLGTAGLNVWQQARGPETAAAGSPVIEGSYEEKKMQAGAAPGLLRSGFKSD